MNNRSKNRVRKPIVEGIFYPSDKKELELLIESYSKNKKRGKAQIIVSPHAGYEAAGELIAEAFLAAADRNIEEVVIISPVHREEKDKIILPSSSAFTTSAGDLQINMKSLHLFKGDDSSIVRDEIPHLEEHSIEDQLPFISYNFGDVKILPILLGKTTITMVKKLTKALTRAYGESSDKVLFVVTSNLSSYEQKEKSKLNSDSALKLFQKGDWKEICEKKRTGEIDACGAGALAAVLAFFNKKQHMDLIRCCQSLEKGKSVSYGAISFVEKN